MNLLAYEQQQRAAGGDRMVCYADPESRLPEIPHLSLAELRKRLNPRAEASGHTLLPCDEAVTKLLRLEFSIATH